MKFAVSLLSASLVLLTACNTLVTRRDLYTPTRANGPYTQARRTGKLPPKTTPNPKATPKPATTDRENPLPQ